MATRTFSTVKVSLSPSFFTVTLVPSQTVTHADVQTMTLTSAPNPSIYGQAVTFTATVGSGIPGILPGGTVSFTVDGTQVVVTGDAGQTYEGVRYAWRGVPEVTLYNSAALPATPLVYPRVELTGGK